MKDQRFRHCAAAVLLLWAGLTSAGAAGQSRPAAPAPLDPQAIIPLDAAVRTATLPNGLTYFVRQNPRPAHRVSLRLAVKAGSLDEADDQQGLAHLIEHMAFNGSTHFKPGEVFSYFESIGARLGPHVNAYTSFDRTVYMLDLPTDKPEVVAKGITALSDFAGGLTLAPSAIDKERGVVIEEWRGGLGAGSRIRDLQIPVLFFHSRYAERLPIGKPDVIRSAPAARLRAFYDTWYRPERMALIAVGDIDAAAIEQTIRDTFGPLAARAPAEPRASAAVPLERQLLVSVAADSEVTESSVSIVAKRPREGSTRVSDYRRDLVQRMVEQMLDERFSEIARKPEAKFLAASADGEPLSPDVTAFTLGAHVPDGKIDDGVAALVVEAARARQFGFGAGEIERTKRSLASYYERAYAERDKTESGSFAQEYLGYFLDAEPSPGIEYERRIVQQTLPGITAADATAMVKSLLNDDTRVVLAVSPQKPAIHVPSDAEVRAALTSASTTTVTAWADADVTRPLVERLPPPAAIVSRRELPAIGVTIVTLANGVDVWLKPTDFKNDQVLFTMDALGGASLAPPASFVEASLATVYVGMSGVGGLKPADLEKLLAGKLASASPFVGLSTHGISGNAAPAQLETALQLLYQDFMAPGDDPDAFTLLKRQLDASVANREQSPMQVFSEKLEEVNGSNHYTTQPVTRERVASLDRQAAAAFYRERFANAADFTMFMVGAFQIDQVVPLLARYVGSLPSTGHATSRYKDLGIHFPEDITRVTVEKGREPRAEAVLSFFADPPSDPMTQERVIAATTVLDIALRDVLRAELGQTYTVSVGLAQDLPQRGDGHIQVSFGAAPENVRTMSERVIAEIKLLQQDGPSADLTNRAKEAARRGYETSLKQNSYWLRRLSTIHMIRGEPGDILTRQQRIDAITPQTLQEAFVAYFPMSRYTLVTLLPAPAAQ